MEYGAIALAVLGIVIGLFLPLKSLLPIVALVFVASFLLSVLFHYSFIEAALAILVAQAVLQGGYFVGVVLKGILPTSRKNRHVF